MPDLSDVSKQGMKKRHMGGSASRNTTRNDINLSLRAAAEEGLAQERPSRPTPQSRPLPNITDSMTEPRGGRNSSKSKGHGKTFDDTSSAASSPGASQRKHTPATIPRTKFTSATPLEQRIAINRLKQRLDYDEKDEDSSQRGQNYEQAMVNSDGAAGAPAVLYEQASVSSMTESIAASQSEISDMVDTTKILQRLNQVRDYLKQATSLYMNLTTKEYLEDGEMDHIDKLGKLIQQLRVQEQGYVDLLQRTLSMDQSADMTPASSIMSLQQNEAEEPEDQQQELKRLQMQHALLKRIVDQQQQIQDLKKKQASLAALQEQAEELMNAADVENEMVIPNNRRSGELNNWGNGPDQESSRRAVGPTYVAQETEPPGEEGMDNEEAALFDADMIQRKLELENKLMSLQAKKEKMDALLNTLKSSRDTITRNAGGQAEGEEQTRQMRQAEEAPSNEIERNEIESNDEQRNALQQQQHAAQQAVQQVEDVHEKLRKLKQVKQRLEDLTSIVSEYEESQVQPMLLTTVTSQGQQQQQPQLPQSQHDNRAHGLPSGGYGGARPRDQQMFREQQMSHLSSVAAGRDMSDGIDNRMRPTPPGARSQRTAIDVTRNPSSSKDNQISANIDVLSAIGKNLVSDDQDGDLTSKIRQLQEARQRLASVQRTIQSMPSQFEMTQPPTISVQQESTASAETESEPESVSTAEDLSWQEDPEFQAKVRRLQQAKEKLKHLQELVSSVQHDGLSMDELANISISSKAESDDDDDDDDQAGGDTDDEDDVTSEQQSQSEAGNAEEEEDDEEEDDDDDDDDDGDLRSVPEARGDDKASKQSDGSTLNNAVVMLDREIAYQDTLNQQRQELEKLLQEKEKLLEAQRQLSAIARTTLNQTQVAGANGAQKKQEVSPRETKKQPDVRFKPQLEERLSAPKNKSAVDKTGNRVTYKDLQVPRIIKRTSNISVEPQYGSDSSFRIKKKKPVIQTNKRQSAGSRPNPLVMSELRRQREMFEQNKKLKFVEKQRQKRDSGDDRSDGGTYSIRSDIDEGVGHSMFSADVTTAATWGGSTEQSSSEEDSAVGEEDFAEGEGEIEDEYEENMGQPEEEEEEDGGDEVDEDHDNVAPLFDFKKKSQRAKKEKAAAWFEDQNDDRRGKKRKLDARRIEGNRGGSVSWSMNVSPESSTTRNRPRQQNLTPAHKLVRNRTSRTRHDENSIWEEQCQQLRQQLASGTALSTSLLRNQQTLLSMLHNQSNVFFNGGSSSSGLFGQTGFSSNNRNFQQPFVAQDPNQRFQNMLQALNRCTSQLDRQHQEIQHLQREFQNMVLNPSSNISQRVYPWENPSPSLNLESGFGQSRGTDPFRSSQNDSFLNSGPFGSGVRSNYGPRYKPEQTHSATSPHVFTDDTTHRFTQTDLHHFSMPSQTKNSYSLFGQQTDHAGGKPDSTPGDFSPFRFYDLKDSDKDEKPEFFPTTSSNLRVEHRVPRSSNEDTSNYYNPLAYTDTSGRINTTSGATSGPPDVITTSYPTPSKSAAAKNLAERQRATWPPFLKDPDTASERSTSNYGAAANARQEKLEDEIEKEEKMERLSIASNYSLFETMRDSIYSEVATLISMNESRPHYLVELFRELQLLTSDYLRQRALYALQDLVTRFLTEDSEMRQSNEPPEEVYRKWMGTAAVESFPSLPSESVATSDDEDPESKALEALSRQIRNNDMYDYAEIAETGSTMSTPTSTQDPPFAAEGLGDTVINLDEALQKMRTYEEKMADARKKALEQSNGGGASSLAVAAHAAASDNSSAYDVTSEASSDIQQPSIDTQKLDRQIKSIMMELIPFLNEHMEIKCTLSFLAELREIILKLAKQKEPDAEQQEFGRTFHRQLESVLKDSLSRFESRSLKECGEDILIDISEILFNELAFFRLMQDLDRPSSMTPGLFWRKDSESNRFLSDAIGREEAAAKEGNAILDEASSSVGFLVNTSGTIFSPPAPRTGPNALPQRRIFEDALEIEDLEENEEICSDAEDETEAARQFVNVELSVSESRPVASTGSGEEDVEEDQQSFPLQNAAPESSVGSQQQQQQHLQQQQQGDVMRESDDDDAVDGVDEMPEDEEVRGSPMRGSPRGAPQEEAMNREQESASEMGEDERGEDEREEGDRDQGNQENDAVEVDAGAERADADLNNEDGDESEVTVDDLPTKLTGLTEADLQTRMESEQSAVEGASGVLAHIRDQNVEELAEDSAENQPPEQQEPEGNHE